MFFPNNKLFLIAGPCVIESEKMLLETAKKIQEICFKNDIFFIFKSSFDKANRSSITSFRGPGLEKGIEMLLDVKQKLDVPVLTDVHTPEQFDSIPAEIDALQIPAFLSRQTDLYIKAAETKRVINAKKAQFMSPHEVKNIIDKFTESGGEEICITERGSMFGYNNLVVDTRSVPIIKSMGVKYIFDATHSLQLPAGLGKKSGGTREYLPNLIFSQIAAGADGLFMEVHPDIKNAKCDKETQWPLENLAGLLEKAKKLYDFGQEHLRPH